MKNILRIAVLLLAVQTADGATRTWTGTVDNLWSRPENWAEGIVPVAGDDLVFPFGSRDHTFNDLPEGIVFRSVLHDNHNQLLEGNGIGLSDGLTTGTEIFSAVWQLPIRLDTAQTWHSQSLHGHPLAVNVMVNDTLTVFSTAGSFDSDFFIAPTGLGTLVASSGRIEFDIGLNAAGFSGKAIVTGGQTEITGRPGQSGEGPEIELNATCEWSGCTDGLLLRRVTGQSLLATGGYLRLSRHFEDAEINDVARFGHVELGGAVQLNVDLNPFTTLTPRGFVAETATIGGATLRLSSAPFAIPTGKLITLIDNDGADAVTGTFAELAEGQTIATAGGQRFQITYAGGDGNDVVLTALARHDAPSDVDADGKSEILWRHAATGENYRWTMSGPAHASGGYVNVVPDTNWQIAGVADFDGDGDSDLFWRHALTGDNYMYLMQDGSIAGQAWINQVPDPDWQVAGTGDHDGDGEADILWRHATNSALYLYLMNGMQIARTGSLRDVGPQWAIVGLGDLNGDGTSDIVWHNESTGAIYGWAMDDFRIIAESTMLVTEPGWFVAAVGHFDSERLADLILRHETTGEIRLYLQRSLSFHQNCSISTTSAAWQIAGIGDYNGNKIHDILWRNAETGENYMYVMNGCTTIGFEVETVADGDWKVVP